MTEQMSKLLDFSQKLDITLLENIVGCMYTGTGDQVRINHSLIHTFLKQFFLILEVILIFITIYFSSNDLPKMY